MPKIDLKCQKIVFRFLIFRFFFVFDAISIQFSKDLVVRFNTINSTTEERALHYYFSKRTLQCFASKTLQNDYNGVENFQHHRCCATCVLFESFWNQNVSKRSTKTELIVQ